MARRFWPQPLLTESQMTETMFHDISQKRQGFAKNHKDNWTGERGQLKDESTFSFSSSHNTGIYRVGNRLATTTFEITNFLKQFFAKTSHNMEALRDRTSQKSVVNEDGKRQKKKIACLSTKRHPWRTSRRRVRRKAIVRSKYLVVAGGKAFKKVRGQGRQQTNNKRSVLTNPCSLIGEAVTTSGILLLLFFFYFHNRLQIDTPLTTRNPNHCVCKSECNENAWEEESQECTKEGGDDDVHKRTE
jgi:hypothetical protein